MNKKPLLVAFAIISVFLSGCAINNQALKTEQLKSDFDSIEQLEGIYQNQGRTLEGEEGGYLSEMIFPDLTIHEAINIVRVAKVSPAVLKVEALENETLQAERFLTEGKDFEISNSRIKIDSKLSDIGMSEPGAMHIGAGYYSIILYLTEKRDLVIRTKGGAAGVFLVIPFVSVGQFDIIYKRL